MGTMRLSGPSEVSKTVEKSYALWWEYGDPSIEVGSLMVFSDDCSDNVNDSDYRVREIVMNVAMRLGKVRVMMVEVMTVIL